MHFGAKILLEGPDEYQRLIDAMQSLFMYEERYTDFFFDFPPLPITQSAAVLRLRVPLGPFQNAMGKERFASLTLKEGNRVQCGGQMFGSHEVKELGEQMAEEIRQTEDLISLLKSYCSNISGIANGPLGRIVRELESIAAKLATPQQLQQVGSYTTRRRVYRYFSPRNMMGAETINRPDTKEEPLFHSLHIRIDQTEFPFGTNFELEVPDISIPLDDVVADVEKFLQALGVKYNLSLDSKYARFMKYAQGLVAEREEAQGLRLRLAGVEGYKEVLKWLESLPEVKPQPTPGTSHQILSSQVQVDDASFNNSLETEPLYSNIHALLEYSQRTNLSDMSCVNTKKRKIADGVEYQENYCFDDPPMCNLMRQNCSLQLRCIDNGAVFTLALKEEQQVINISQTGFTRCAEISGDVARLLLCNPTEFLVSQREHNSIASALWDEFGLRNLSVTAFFLTHRRVFTKCITDCMSNKTASNNPPRKPPTVDDAASNSWDVPATYSTQHVGNIMPQLCFKLDCTLYDLSVPADTFAVAAGKNSFCSYCSATAVSPATHVKRLYDLEVSDLTLETLHIVNQWVTNMLDHLGVEWCSCVQSKLEQYFAFLETPMLMSQPDPKQDENVFPSAPQ